MIIRKPGISDDFEKSLADPLADEMRCSVEVLETTRQLIESRYQGPCRYEATRYSPHDCQPGVNPALRGWRLLRR